MKSVLRILSVLRVLKPNVRESIYACFFFSGSTALIWEVLWSREFVTVFGNSSYAISVVLCAYMSGLGLGSWLGGKVADRVVRRLEAYGTTQWLIGLWALGMPFFTERVRSWVAAVPALSSGSLLESTLTRFGLSFGMLAVPCFLMGTTMPLLVRAVTRSDRGIGRNVGALYCWNTLGAAVGCWAAGFWMLETLGLAGTNLVAVGINGVTGAAAFILAGKLARPAGAGAERHVAQDERDKEQAHEETATSWAGMGKLLLAVAFLNGLASLMCEVLWFRYLAFLGHEAYVFPTLLGIYLLGLGFGGLIYSRVAGRMQSLRALGTIEVALGLSVLATFAVSGMIFSTGPPRPLRLRDMGLLNVSLPTVLMGMALPLLFSLYSRKVESLGGKLGAILGVNTAGTVLGSLLPIFFLVPHLGIQRSFILASGLYGGMGLILLGFVRGGWRWVSAGGAIYGGALAVFLAAVPANLCQRVFLATDFNLGRHTDILFYLEGRTGTSVVTRDRANECKTIYINGASEVPALYAHEICFKLMGDLGPMLHPKPDDVLMLCLGGGLASGAVLELPQVHTLTIVDIEPSVVKAAALLSKENNGLLTNSKARILIDDGRNYVMTSRRKWPVIISDSTHPKSADSWVLYTREFYRQVQERLTPDGIFVEWVPRHQLRTAEFKIISRTFQSVFPHTSLWVSDGVDEQGQLVTYGLLVGTAQPLRINVGRLRERLGAASVQADLAPFGMNTVAGFLDAFICAEGTLRGWVGDGPLNTDDLPYTQYDTKYARGGLMDPWEFNEPMEDLWPRLTGTGTEAESKSLHDELVLRRKATRLALLNRLKDSFAVLPRDSRYHFMRALYDHGPGYVDVLTKVYSNNPEALVHLSTFLEAGPSGMDGVRALLERVLVLDPGNVIALNTLAMAHSDAGDMETAEAHLRRALREDRHFVPARCNLAVLLERTGRHLEALEQWEKAAVDSDDAKAADEWGVCLAGGGRGAEAAKWFQRAMQLQPSLLSAKLHMALWYHLNGNTPEAISRIRNVLKIDPENQLALSMLQKLQELGAESGGSP